ncbi:hypothetical protein TRFO_24082 [Tritrichomonas foetus]|uniref:Uncharacterized protein n=1 Tax=Tritrichomonas foetus TaxID=1144522 RepID=A0A1J4K9P1_9EUKA|nr:hypothetical protein TRFO_24082 [Tritrichomonas foetus]|eukprot:OHT07666.1 hypothetical protein TRFO_24082 [Tritrichomonas foetus]
MNFLYFIEKTDSIYHLVPDIPETLLSASYEASNKIREDILYKQRISTLIPLLINNKGNLPYLPQQDRFHIIHSCPNDALSLISPQQVQFISNMVDFISKNPVTIIRALQFLLQKQKINDFLFLCYSSIPSFFGYFSTNEHLTSAFSFFCTLVGTSNETIVRHALLPFYCNSCTFRFIENLFDKFGLVFCHDFRFYNQKVQKSILMEYVKPFVNSIIDSYPLLPQPHQFLLKFMKVRGWKNEQVLKFFIEDFTIVQLLRYMKTTPFQTHFEHFSKFVKTINLDVFSPLLEVFSNAKSFFEVPMAYSVFDLYFVQLLTTTADVKALINVLVDCGEVPQCIQQFIETANITKPSYEPFWIRFYSRKPRPVDSSFNWRPVVFSSIDTKNMPGIDEYEKRFKNSHLDRKSFIDTARKEEKFHEFFEILKAKEYNNKSRVFEQYLVHQMAKLELKYYQHLVQTYYTTIVQPYAINVLQSKMKMKIQPTATNIVKILEVSLDGIESPQVLQLLFMMIVQWVVPSVIPPNRLKQLQHFEMEWQNHVEEIREQITLPEMFKNKKGNERTALLFHRKLWSAIEHLRCLQKVKFEWTLKVIIDSLSQLDELLRLDDSESTVIQFATAVCDCPSLISRFLIINTFVAKQKIFHSMTTENRDLLLWYRFENAILKLLSKNEKLMLDFLSFQDELIGYQFSNLFCEFDPES